MLEFLTGIISGTVSGTGMGGGTILILILSVFMGINQHVAQATNLIFFVPTSITAIIATMREKLIDWKIGIPVAISGIIGAIFGAKISVNMNVNNLKRYFGIFLILITIYEIYSLIKTYKIDKKSNNKIEK
ncbi:MAG: sulfite exporter TauE/SafE family protein [Clostridia bacterium]|nr:sulfite exporter TauE/SafE family protein [Clostridia bacterium]